MATEENTNFDNNDTKQTKNRVDMNSLLKENLGEFGRFQKRTMFILCFAVTMISLSDNEYVFTTSRIATRCRIPECEDIDNVEFAPEWILNAIPATSSGFDNCQRYANVSVTLNGTVDTCPAALFDPQTIVSCDDYVYETRKTIVYDFDLACDDWRRTLVGTIRMSAMFVSMLLVGMISDHWGRRGALILVACNSAWIGNMRIFATTYTGFTIAQFAESSVGSGVFTCAFVLNSEMIGTNYRVFFMGALGTFHTIGSAICAFLAWLTPTWRIFLLTIYIPQAIAIVYLWLLPESPRWYITKRRYEDAEKTLKEMALYNGKHLSDQNLMDLRETAEEDRKLEMIKNTGQEPWLVTTVFRNKILLKRVFVLSICWISVIFVYHGLSIAAVNLSGNLYINYVAASFVEVPGFWFGAWLMNTIGRKAVVITSFWVCAVCQLAYLIIPFDMFWASMTVYLISKTAIAISSTAMYVFTSELYPTRYRQRLFGFNSTMGRLGAAIAPLTPAFGPQLPFALFGGFCVLAGGLVFLMPETRNARLPDNVKDLET